MKLEYMPLSAWKTKKAAGEDPGACILRKAYAASVESVGAPEDLTQAFTISTGAVDRDHDTLSVPGWKLENFLSNPVCLWCHDYNQPPVAQALTVTVGDSLRSVAKFTPRDLYAFGFMIHEFYRLGFMRATSVGFNPIEGLFNMERGGFDFREQELLEYSCVPVPANPEALVGAKSAGIDLEPLRAWACKALDEWSDEKGLWVPRSQLEAVVKLAGTRGLIVTVGETGIEVKAEEKQDVPGGNLPVAPAVQLEAEPMEPQEPTAEEAAEEEAELVGYKLLGSLLAQIQSHATGAGTLVSELVAAEASEAGADETAEEMVECAKLRAVLTIGEQIGAACMALCDTAEGLLADEMDEGGGMPWQMAPMSEASVRGFKVGRVLSAKSEKHIRSAHAELEACLKQIETEAEEGKGFTKGVVPSDVSDKKASEDTAWSAPSLKDFTDKGWGDLSDAEKKRIAGHFAWASEMPPETFGSLKLPHHRASDGSVVWRGVAAAMGALLGARGGPDIPDADRRKVYAHLSAHYRQFDKEPPEFKDAEPAVLKLAEEPQEPLFVVRIEDEPFLTLAAEAPPVPKPAEPSFNLSAEELQTLRRTIRNTARASATAVTGRLYDEE